MTSGGRRVVFVDLDDTLVVGNTFHTFLLTCWRRGGARARWGLVLAAGLRAVSPGSRVTMKRRVLATYAALPAPRRRRIESDLVRWMHASTSERVLALVDARLAAGDAVVLATAAPDCYARPFADALGLTDCLATSSDPRGGWFELLGERKAQACRAWLAAQGATHTTVVTDHADDLALLDIADEAHLHASARAFGDITAAYHAGADARHLDTADQTHGGDGLWLWFDDRLSGPHDSWEARTILSKHRYALVYLGNRRWRRAPRPRDLRVAPATVHRPPPPPLKTRALVLARRRVVRDVLRIFH